MPLAEAKRAEDGSAVLDEDEKLLHSEGKTELLFTDNKSAGSGTLSVTNKHVIWISDDGKRTYKLEYPKILLHAVTTDKEAFPHPSIYLQLDLPDEEDAEFCEVRFVPASGTARLEKIYTALCDGALLNPDENRDDEEDAGDFYFDKTEVDTNMEAMYDEGDDDADMDTGEDGAASGGGASAGGGIQLEARGVALRVGGGGSSTGGSSGGSSGAGGAGAADGSGATGGSGSGGGSEAKSGSAAAHGRKRKMDESES